METVQCAMVSGFLPAASLIEALVRVSKDVTSMNKLLFLQVRNSALIIRKIKLLSSLFEDIQEANGPLPPSLILCFTELLSVTQKTKAFIEECKAGAALWNLLQTEFISQQFHRLEKEMESSLDILPLSLLNMSADVQEQVQLLHKQAKRSQVFVDPFDCLRREELLQVMSINNNHNSSNKYHLIDCKKIEEIMCSLGLRSPLDYQEEIQRLELEVSKQAGTGGLVVVYNINNLISLVAYLKSVIFADDGDENITGNMEQSSLPCKKTHDRSLSTHLLALNIPDEFRCPISLDLMRDPVIVASGHTYDRNSITQWINSGHHTCPKSGQKLIHMALIPNYALKSLICQWCQDYNVPLCESLLPYPPGSESCKRNASTAKAIEHISLTKSAVEAVKMTADFLVGKLATGSPEIQRQAAFELRLLAKSGMNNRRIIAEAGAIPFLVTLLSSHDPKTQENAVTALLNLSIFSNNKGLIMEAGAINSIIEVLEMGRNMEARENAAATIFSLSMADECKVTIGTQPRAIPGLVRLLREGTTLGKRDAATALFNLAVYNANKVSVVAAGAIPLLIDLLVDDKAGITDEALALLALLSGSCDGLKEIRENKVALGCLLDLLRFGSPNGKANSAVVLLGMCRNGEEIARRLLINPHTIPSLQSLASDGSPKARRQAAALLRLLNRYCSPYFHPVE